MLVGGFGGCARFGTCAGGFGGYSGFATCTGEIGICSGRCCKCVGRFGRGGAVVYMVEELYLEGFVG